MPNNPNSFYLGDNPVSNPLYALSEDVPPGFRIWTKHGFYLLNEKMNRTAVFRTLEEALDCCRECFLTEAEVYHFYDSLFFPKLVAIFDRNRRIQYVAGSIDGGG